MGDTIYSRNNISGFGAVKEKGLSISIGRFVHGFEKENKRFISIDFVSSGASNETLVKEKSTGRLFIHHISMHGANSFKWVSEVKKIK